MSSSVEQVRYPHALRGIVCALFGAIFWGFSGTCAQLLMDNYAAPSEWITSVRMICSAVFFLAVALAKNWRSLIAVMRDLRSLAWIAAFALFGILLMQISYLNVIRATSAGVGTTLEQLGLIFIMFWTCFKTKRLPFKREMLGLLFALAGTVVIATQGDLSTLALTPEALFWGFLAAFSFALYTLIPVMVLKKWGAMLVTGLAMLFGGAASSVAIHPWNVPIDLSFGALAALTAIILIGTCAAYMLYLQGINDAGPVRAGLLCAAEPVSAMILAAVWLQSPVSTYDVLGCAIILVMVVLVTDLKSLRGSTTQATLIDPVPVFEGRATALGLYYDRIATADDFERIQKLLNQAHETYEELGIKEGRYKRYPSARRLMHSIKNGSMHIVTNSNDELLAVFGLSFDVDKNYLKPIKGAWLTDSQKMPPVYAELHWLVVDKQARRRGVGSYVFDRCERLARQKGRASIRLDIYPENEPMRWLVDKRNYSYCGVIEVRNTFGFTKKRSAYERLL